MSSGDDINCWPVCPVYKRVLVEVWREAGLDVVEDEPLKALHDYRGQCHQSVVRSLWQISLGTVIMVAAFRQAVTVACFREVLTILIRTPNSWSAQVFSTLLSTPSGPAG